LHFKIIDIYIYIYIYIYTVISQNIKYVFCSNNRGNEGAV